MKYVTLKITPLFRLIQVLFEENEALFEKKDKELSKLKNSEK